MTEYEAFVRAEAMRRGIDPDKAVIVANAEGGLTEPARLGDFSGPPWFSGKSWYAFQLHWGGRGYEHFGTVAGMGNSFTAATGWQPGDPAAWKDSVRYALDAVKLGGWGPWYGAAARGITGYDGVNRSFFWPGTPPDEWDYRAKSPAPPAVAYDPDAPVDVQPDDWSCSVQSAQWLLRSIGRRPGDQWLEGQLVGPLESNPIVSREYGLMDASGKTLAAWLQREYGDEMGVTFEARQGVTWEQVTALAGKRPVMVGGRTWAHWSGVRRVDDGALSLANPAPNWKGVGTALDEREWDAFGSWSAITATLPATAPKPPAYHQPGDVGTGLMALMEADGTAPALPSTFLPLGRPAATVEECYGLNGWKYVWHLPTGKSWKYPPAA